MAEETPTLLEEAPPDERQKPKDTWDKWEAAAKIIGATSIPIIGILATFILGQESERNRAYQFELNLTQAREAADSDVRAKMFDFLLTRYFTVQNGPITSVEEFQTRRMILRLLLENFQEHFSSKALFAHLYQQAQNAEAREVGDAKKPWQAVKEELIEVGRNTISEQLISLAPVAFMVSDIFVPLVKDIDPNSPSDSQQPGRIRVALYPTQGLTGGELVFYKSTPEWHRKDASGSEVPRYSIELAIKQIREDAATTNVWIYEDKYVDKAFDAEGSRQISRFQFDASYFSTPYTDNTLLPNANRFAMIYKGCMDADDKEFTCRFPLDRSHRILAQFDVVIFKANFITRRDRPDIDKLLETVRQKNEGGVLNRG